MQFPTSLAEFPGFYDDDLT